MALSADQARREALLLAEWMKERNLTIGDCFAVITLLLRIHLDSIAPDDADRAVVMKAVRRVLGDLPN